VGDLVDRLSGPMKLRFLLQPAMAAIFAVRAGLKDAKLGRSPYLLGLITDPAHRSEMLKDGLKDVGKVIFLALSLDIVYQIIVLHVFYPGEMVVVVFVLAIAPYLVLRGLVMRLAPKK
jgi:hypothetical protein